MGYVLRVRFASFFTGAALASAAGLYFLQKDYKIAHHAISQQMSSVGKADVYPVLIILDKLTENNMNGLYESLDGRVSALEKLKEAEAPNHVDTAE